MASFGSFDLMMANPPEGLPESSPCVCGHTLEDHAEREPLTGLSVCAHCYSGGDHVGCDCAEFRLDEQ